MVCMRRVWKNKNKLCYIYKKNDKKSTTLKNQIKTKFKNKTKMIKEKRKKMSKVEEICINFKEPESLLTLFSINLKVSNSCQWSYSFAVPHSTHPEVYFSWCNERDSYRPMCLSLAQ